MRVRLEGARGAFVLDDPDDFQRFAVDAGGAGPDALAAALAAHHMGEPDHAGAPDGAGVIVRVDAVRRLAGAAAGTPQWSASFEAMLDYARSHGWLTDDGSGIQAHVENGGDAGPLGTAGESGTARQGGRAAQDEPEEAL